MTREQLKKRIAILRHRLATETLDDIERDLLMRTLSRLKSSLSRETCVVCGASIETGTVYKKVRSHFAPCHPECEPR